jgi:hypothetical protein
MLLIARCGSAVESAQRFRFAFPSSSLALDG